MNNTTGQEPPPPRVGLIRNGLKTAEELGLLGTSLIIVGPIQKPPSQAAEETASQDANDTEFE
jgi:hypothetical protein